MSLSLDDLVIDFYNALFERIFSDPFRAKIADRIRRNAVLRQIAETADAASQSLIRFLRNTSLTAQQADDILQGFNVLSDLLKLEDIANANATPESLTDSLLKRI